MIAVSIREKADAEVMLEPIGQGAATALRNAIRSSAFGEGVPETAIVVGARDLEVVRALHEQLPSVRRVLLLEPDTLVARRAQALIAARPQGLLEPDAYRIEHGYPSDSPYSFDAYLIACQFLIATGDPIDRVFFTADDESLAARPDLYHPLATALADLEWAQSRTFFQLLPSPDAIPDTFAAQFSHYLTRTGAAYLSLRLTTLLRDRLGERGYARRAADALMALNCVEPLLALVPLVATSAAHGAAMERELGEAVARNATTREQTFARNLQALAQHHAALGATLASEDLRHDYHLASLPALPWWVTGDGARPIARERYPLFFRFEGDRLDELNPPTSPVPLAERLALARNAETPPLLVGSLERAEVLVNLATPSPRGTYIVATEPSELKAVLQTFDLSPMLAHGRTRIFAGPDAAASLVQELTEHAGRTIPHVRAGVGPELEARFQTLVLSHLEQAAQIIAGTRRRYRDEQGAELVAALTGRVERPLRVLVFTTGQGPVPVHSLRGFAAGFRALGHEVTFLCDPQPNESVHVRELAETVDTILPDLVLTVDKVRALLGNLRAALPLELPLVAWTQEQLPALLSRTAAEHVGPRDLVCSIDAALVERHHAAGYKEVAHVPFGVDPSVYRPVAGTAQRDEVAYLTHLYAPIDPRGAPGLVTALEPLLDEVQVMPSATPDFLPYVTRAFDAIGCVADDATREQALFVALLLGRVIDRVRIARALDRAGIPLALYGLGWERYPDLVRLTRGVVAGEALRDVYQSSRVVLHVHTHLNLHLRVFEAIASGGLVIARSTPDDHEPGQVAEHLALGDELVTFTDEDELLALVRRAFADEPWRQERIAAGQRRVLAEHTYAHRARAILGRLRARLLAHETP